MENISLHSLAIVDETGSTTPTTKYFRALYLEGEMSRLIRCPSNPHLWTEARGDRMLPKRFINGECYGRLE
jgi:hypothetical protein